MNPFDYINPFGGFYSPYQTYGIGQLSNAFMGGGYQNQLNNAFGPQGTYTQTLQGNANRIHDYNIQDQNAALAKELATINANALVEQARVAGTQPAQASIYGADQQLTYGLDKNRSAERMLEQALAGFPGIVNAATSGFGNIFGGNQQQQQPAASKDPYAVAANALRKPDSLVIAGLRGTPINNRQM